MTHHLQTHHTTMSRFITCLSLLCALTMGALSTALAVPTLYQEGQHYTTVAKPQKYLAVPAGKVEVVEAFWYGCSHCYSEEPKVQAWLAKGKPSNVVFGRLPATFNDAWKHHARLYFTAQRLGVTEKLHPLIFNSIHQANNRLDTPAKAQAFFIANGVSAAKFNTAFSSSQVTKEIERADAFVRGVYKLDSVPTFIVGGRYITNVSMAGGNTQLFNVINDLTQMEKRKK